MQAIPILIRILQPEEGGFDGRIKQRGSVIIEFILIAPLMLFLIGYCLRLTQLLQANNIAMMVSREVATEAFLRCTDITIYMVENQMDPTKSVDIQRTTTAARNCINRIQSTTMGHWSAIRPVGNPGTFEIDVEVYRFGLARYNSSLDCSQRITSADKTRISTDPNGLNDAFSSPDSLLSLCRRNRSARARISFPFNPVSTFLTLIPGFVDSTVTIVDDTVI